MTARKLRRGFLVALLVCSAGPISGVALGSDFLAWSNPLGLYVGVGAGRSTIIQTELDQYASYYHVLDGNASAWEAYIGIRPIRFLGVEADYIDFGRANIGAGPVQYLGEGDTEQYLGAHADNRALAGFVVGYLPLPIPSLEPFAKVGFAVDREHDAYAGNYYDVFVQTQSGYSAVGHAYGSNTTNPIGAAYGGGIQFHSGQIAIRAQYLRLSLQRPNGQWNNPSVLSVGLSWTL